MFQELRAELMEEVDEVWSDRIQLLPLEGGKPDQAREKSEFDAILRTGERQEERANFGSRNAAPPGVNAGGGVLRVNRVANPDLVIRQGDKIVAPERPGEPLFLVLHVDDRSHLRLVCKLGDAV